MAWLLDLMVGAAIATIPDLPPLDYWTTGKRQYCSAGHWRMACHRHRVSWLVHRSRQSNQYY
jgi:hypothetical protein